MGQYSYIAERLKEQRLTPRDLVAGFLMPIAVVAVVLLSGWIFAGACVDASNEAWPAGEVRP